MKRISMLSLLATVAVAAPAAADEAGRRTHDGFYLRLMAGPAYMLTKASLDPDPAGGSSSLTGFGVGGLVMAGVTPASGVVVGGGAMGAHLFSPRVSAGGVSSETDADAIGLAVGPFVDYYPDPADGLHFLGLLGVATFEDGNDASDDIALGIGGVVGAGYDWWVSDQWSVGAMARLQLMRTKTTLESGGGTANARYTTLMPVLMITAAYH